MFYFHGEAGTQPAQLLSLNVYVIYVSHSVLRVSAPTLFACVIFVCHFCVSDSETGTQPAQREVGGWGRDPKKCAGRDWGMGSSTI